MQFIFTVFLQCFLMSKSITHVENTSVHHLAIIINDNQYSIKSLLININQFNLLKRFIMKPGFL